MKGKAVLITGANSGIGLATAGALAALTGLDEIGARSNSGDSTARRYVRALKDVTKGAAARTNEEHSLALTARSNQR